MKVIPAISALLLTLAGSACTSAQVARIQVDTTTRFQTMRGWEATSQAGQDEPPYPRYRDTLIALAAGDLGLNRLRLEVRSGSEHTRDYWNEGRANRLVREEYRCARYETVNDNADPRVINWAGFRFSELDHAVEQLALPLKRAVEQRGQRFVLNMNYVAFFPQCPPGRRYDHGDPEEYAEFALAVVLHLREKYGLVPDLWEVILEPENTDHWNGTLIGRAIVATARRFREHGLSIRFVAPSNTSMSGALRTYDELIRVPGARAELAELSYHRYRMVSLGVLQAIGERTRRDSVHTAMLEHIGSGIDDLLDDLTIGQVSAWQQFALAFANDRDRGGLYYRVVLPSPDRPVLVEGSRTRLLKQVFRYVRHDAVRVGARSDQAGVRTVAFQNADGRCVVSVRTGARTRVLVFGLPAGRYGMSYATDRDTGSVRDTVVVAGDTIAATIPGGGVLTVFAR